MQSSRSLRQFASRFPRLLLPTSTSTTVARRGASPALLHASHYSNSSTSAMTTVQVRSMVMVTKTKAGEAPPPPDNNQPQGEEAASPTSNNNDHSQQQERLVITDGCWKQVLRLAQRKNLSPSDLFLRVYVDAGGCSGFEYKFEVETDADALEEDDVVWEGPEGARVVVDETSLEFINGATLDYVVEMIKSAFTVKDNPQSEAACGCGSSFAVKNFSTNPALD